MENTLTATTAPQFDIVLSGVLYGRNWYGQECGKHFEERFSTNEHKAFARHWQGLREAAEHITNDGDFQDCKLALVTLTVERCRVTSTGKQARSSVSYMLESCKLLADVWASDEEALTAQDAVFGELD